MLVVSDLVVHYGMHEALSSVSLEVSRDEIVVILGANGAGKSSLLSAIAGSCAGHVNGDIVFDGNPLLGSDASVVVEQGIAFVPESRGVFADMSVEENLQLGSYSEHARQREQTNLKNVFSLFPKLAERRKQIVRTMSGGEQQMVAIGRALMSAPSILMLDEPSLGLSPLLCKELFSSLQRVRDSGVGILLVEQNAKQSLSISDRGYLLGNGEIIGQDTASNLLNNPAVQAAYLGGAMAPQSSAPIASTKSIPSAPAAMAPASTEPKERSSSAGPKIIHITPDAAHSAAPSTSSGALLNEDIDALVARASSSASEYRTTDSALPPQVVKLTSSASKPTSASPSRSIASAGKHSGVTNLDHNALPETQDSKVQALLADFEAAAKRAASGSKRNDATITTASAKRRQDEEHYPLPHIPIYKKSSVTVYRRDSSGTLRKQDNP